MSKRKWLAILSVAGVLILSGAAYALTSSAVKTANTQGVTPDAATTNPAGAPDGTATPPSTYGPFGDWGYGMMGGAGMMGGGYGMMGGFAGTYGGAGYEKLNKDSAARDARASLQNATIDKSSNTVTYTGQNVNIVMLGGPEGADDKFVVGGLINPTLRVPKGAKVTLELINADEGMPHGIELTSALPPYPYMSMMLGGIYPDTFVPPVPAAGGGVYPALKTTFSADYPGTYYYLCQVPGHAAEGMYGKIVIEG